MSKRQGMGCCGIIALVLAAVGSIMAPVVLPQSRVLAAPVTQPRPVARAARLGGDEKRTRFVLDMDRAVGFSVYVVPDPFRVIIDLPEIDFKLPPRLGKAGQGLVTAYRYGQFSPGKSRIVIDSRSPVLIEKSFIINPTGGQPARLVVDMVRTSASNFSRLYGKEQARAAAKKRPAKRKQARRTAARRTGKAGRRNRREEARPPRSARRTIVIDPGHGGVDPGTRARSGVSEKSVVLAFSKVLYRKLKATGRYNVYLTRNRDIFLPLRKRVDVARRRRADLFIAIHADAVRRGSVRGATVYTLSERASDKEAAALAAKENRSDIIAGVDLKDENSAVTGILIDLAQRETKNHSVYFAKTMVKALRRATRVRPRPHRFAGFRVLKAPDVPSVLLELGYLSTPSDERLLRSNAWRKKTAAAVVRSIGIYFRSRLAGGGLQ